MHVDFNKKYLYFIEIEERAFFLNNMKSCIILLLGVLIVKAGNVETNEISPQKQITTVEDVKLEIKIFFGVLRGLIDAAINYIFDAFIPTLHRVRRSALPQEQYYMDTIVTGVGAMFDKQNVSNCIFNVINIIIHALLTVSSSSHLQCGKGCATQGSRLSDGLWAWPFGSLHAR